MASFEMKFDEMSGNIVQGLSNLYGCSKSQAVSKAIQLLCAACAKNRKDGSELAFVLQVEDRMVVEPIEGILPE